MWVNPRDLFRPCPDPEISDTRCEVQFSPRVWRAHQYWFKEIACGRHDANAINWSDRTTVRGDLS